MDFHAELVDLRTNFELKDIFWNLIYYFNEYHLPYEFILPYEDKTFEKESKDYKKETVKSVRLKQSDGRSTRSH